MSANSKIEWTDHTFNPWEGCTKVSPGCANCYAETLVDKRYGRVKWGKGNPRRRTSAANWKQPLRWNAKAGDWDGIETFGGMPIEHHRTRVFCASLADWLDSEVPIEWLADLLVLIWLCANLDFLLLSKRPEGWRKRMIAAVNFASSSNDEKRFPIAFILWLQSWLGVTSDGIAVPPNNVWIGTSVEDQVRADKRIPHFLEIPAAVRFLSCEPLLGPLDLARSVGQAVFWRNVNDPDRRIDWVILGGESGPGSRSCKLDWIRDIVAQCKTAGVAAFVKQLGSRPRFDDARDCESLRTIFDRKGGKITEWPEDLRVRQFPATK